jgi:cytochrome b subunit of formate dehydrogenase
VADRGSHGQPSDDQADACQHRDALRSMIKGWVTVGWAKRHASGWLEEEEPAEAAEEREPASTVS